VISTAPSEARWLVMNWQSSNSAPARRSAATSQTSATFDASGTRLNMLSPQKTRPNPTP
jgi:hypothetical protein